jgi:hypothetical protein
VINTNRGYRETLLELERIIRLLKGRRGKKRKRRGGAEKIAVARRRRAP